MHSKSDPAKSTVASAPRSPVGPRRRNGRADWDRIDSLPNMNEIMVRPEDRNKITTYTSHDIVVSPRINKSKIVLHHHHNVNTATTTTNNHEKKKKKKKNHGNTSRWDALGNASGSRSPSRNDGVNNGVQITPPTLKGFISPSSGRRRRFVKMVKTMNQGSEESIELPFGDDSDKSASSRTTLSSWSATKKPLKSAMKKHKNQNSNDDQKQNYMTPYSQGGDDDILSKLHRSVSALDDSDATSTTRSISKLNSSSSNITMDLSDCGVSVSIHTIPPLHSRWGEPLSSNPNRRDDTPVLPPTPRRSISPTCSPTPPVRRGIEATLSSDSIAEMPPLTRYCDDDETTADRSTCSSSRGGINSDDHFTTTSSSSTSDDHNSLNKSSHHTIDTVEDRRSNMGDNGSDHTVPSPPDEEQFDFDTPRFDMKAVFGRNTKKDNGVEGLPTSFDMVEAVVEDTPLQQAPATMGSLKPSPTSVMQDLTCPMASPLAYKSRDSLMTPTANPATAVSEKPPATTTNVDREPVITKKSPQKKTVDVVWPTRSKSPKRVKKQGGSKANETKLDVPPLIVDRSPTQKRSPKSSRSKSPKKRNDNPPPKPQVEATAGIEKRRRPRRASTGMATTIDEFNHSMTSDSISKTGKNKSDDPQNDSGSSLGGPLGASLASFGSRGSPGGPLGFSLGASLASFGSLDLNDAAATNEPARFRGPPKWASPPPPPPPEEHALSPIRRGRKKSQSPSQSKQKKVKQKQPRRGSTGTMTSYFQNEAASTVVDRGMEKNDLPPLSPQKSPKKKKKKKKAIIGASPKQAHCSPSRSPKAKKRKQPRRGSTGALVAKEPKEHVRSNGIEDSDSPKKLPMVPPLSQQQQQPHHQQQAAAARPRGSRQPRRGSTGTLSMARYWEEQLIPTLLPSPRQSPQNSPMSSGRSGQSGKLAAKWEAMLSSASSSTTTESPLTFDLPL